MLKRTSLKRKTRLRRASAKQKLRLAEYRRLRLDFLRLNPYCQATGVVPAEQFSRCTFRSTTIHHMGHHGSVKRGTNTNNTSDWLACCQSCHSWIESHKNTARKLNLLT